MYFFTISLSVLGMRNVSDKSLEKSKTYFMFNKFFFLENLAVYEIMSKTFVHPDWSQTI